MTEHLDTGPYFDRTGRPISAAEYERLRADPLYRVVASDTDGELRVSTMWMGTDLSFGGCMSLESCVFRGRQLVAGPDRYMDDREALEGHAQLCREHLGREPEREPEPGPEPSPAPKCERCERYLVPVLDFGRPGETHPCRCVSRAVGQLREHEEAIDAEVGRIRARLATHGAEGDVYWYTGEDEGGGVFTCEPERDALRDIWTLVSALDARDAEIARLRASVAALLADPDATEGT